MRECYCIDGETFVIGHLGDAIESILNNGDEPLGMEIEIATTAEHSTGDFLNAFDVEALLERINEGAFAAVGESVGDWPTKTSPDVVRSLRAIFATTLNELVPCPLYKIQNKRTIVISQDDIDSCT